jgi:phage gpG-like protein
MIKVRRNDLTRLAREMKEASRAAIKERAVGVLRVAVEQAVDDFKAAAYASTFGPPKVRGSGPPLIDSGKYIDSFTVSVVGTDVLVTVEGQNDRMSNYELGELLEYGYGNIPARPHQRWLTLRAIQSAKAALKKEGFRVVLGHS